MENINIHQFSEVQGTSDSDYIVLSLSDFSSAKIKVGLWKSAMTPKVIDGVWWIGSTNTGIKAEGENGKTPVFRQGATGIEWSYEGEDAWSVIVPYSELSLKFEDLTSEQLSMLKLTFDDLTPSDIAELQKPANDMIGVLQTTNAEMQAAKNDAQNTADHPTYIGIDNYVYKWNKASKVYENTNIYVKGDTGEQGVPGERGEKGEQGDKGDQGETGENGLPPTIELGTVVTLEPGSNASAELVYKGMTEAGSPVYALNLNIPRGSKGENGSGSGNVLVSTDGLKSAKVYLFQPSQDGSAEGIFVEYEPETPNIDLVQSDWNETDESSDAYIKNKPTIPAVVTENTVSGWGFTKNEGTITEVKMNGESKGTSGVVNLGKVLTEVPKMEIVNHGTNDTAFTLTPNVLHKWSEVSELSLSLPEESTESVDFFMVEFVSGSTATTLTLPDSVKFNTEVSIEVNKTYQISIMNDLGVIGGF